MLPSPCIELNEQQQKRLLDIARHSIEQGMATGARMQVNLQDYESELREAAAVFVTLTRDGGLRGCIGSLQARVALAQAVVDSAFNSALQDPRFEPLAAPELDVIRIEISILSAPQEMPVESRDELLRSLRPGIDGLIIEDRGKRATFLPKVWDSLTTPAAFVEQLMLKAGLGAGHWSRHTRVQRYSTLTFADN
jgi:AmmeMemoRadiSam system protein A